jgi:hypothetical protein
LPSFFCWNRTGNVPEHQELVTATTRSYKPNALSSPVKEEKEEEGGGEGGGGGSKTEGRSKNRRKVENDGVL